jgi:hypothetical protein
MRKLVTFLIVLIIQISIIFALYKWYVNYDNNSLSPKEVNTDNLIKQPSMAKKNQYCKTRKNIGS